MKQKRINIFLQVVELDQSILAGARATSFSSFTGSHITRTCPLYNDWAGGQHQRLALEIATLYLASRVLPHMYLYRLAQLNLLYRRSS
jgi:hypothetical protein